jgi:hypothetical protein
MANQAEKEALGLPSDASEEQVLKKIQKLSTQAEEAKALKKQLDEQPVPEEGDADNAARVDELTQANEGLVKSNDELTAQNEALKQRLVEAEEKARGFEAAAHAPVSVSSVQLGDDEQPGEGQVRTEYGIEDTVEKRVKVLSCTWATLENNPLKKGEYILTEHRATRGDVVNVPVSVATRYSKPDIDAFFDTVDEEGAGAATPEEGFAQMSEADLINWHRMNSPSVKEVVDAAQGDADIARKLVAAETAATGGDPREEVIHGLSEVIGRANS